MSHPYAGHRQHAVERNRVSHITKGYASGGAVHSDAAADMAMIKSTVKKSALKMDGGKSKHRADKPGRKHRAHGGRAPKAKGTNVNIMIGAAPDKPPMVGPGPMPIPAAAPMPRPVAPPMGPGAAPAGGAPLPVAGIRRHGGRAFAKGGAVKHRADGGATDGEAESKIWKFMGADKSKLSRKLGAKPPWYSSQIQRDPFEAEDQMRGQMQRAKDISEAVPRGRARGGAVKAKDGPGWTESERTKTKVQHSNEMEDTIKNMNRGRVVTYKTGGAVEHPVKGGMAPKLPGGAGGGLARMRKQKMVRNGMAP